MNCMKGGRSIGVTGGLKTKGGVQLQKAKRSGTSKRQRSHFWGGWGVVGVCGCVWGVKVNPPRWPMASVGGLDCLGGEGAKRKRIHF